ncbi:MAG: hypothetical protein PHW08_11690 [Kiritimatiellae bacterium]|nr:hypothetical protein [Kiritimatiellia bacterium]
MKQRPKQHGGGLKARRSAGLVALACTALLAGGCASPTTGRVRDAQLLYGDWQRPAAIAEARQAGPFFEHVATADGAERDSWRPFLHTRISAADGAASHAEWLWPVYSENRRDGALSWRFLLWFGQDPDTADDDSAQRLWLFPIWFQGRSQQGEDYAALFPVYGTICDMIADRIHFALFPLWLEVDRVGNRTQNVLWPIFSRTRGETANGFKVFPLYGQLDRTGKGREKFVLWPIWTSSVHTNRNPGTAWMLFPVVGRVNRESESTWMALPPFFNFTHGRGKLEGYRKINCPWPIIRIVDEGPMRKRVFFPFWGRKWHVAGKYDACWAVWPFYSSRHVVKRDVREKARSLTPVYHQSSLMRDADGDGEFETPVENFLRVWPLFSARADGTNSFLKVPDLSFSKRTGALERNLLDMFTLYTRGGETSPRRVDHEALWGMLRLGRGEAYRATRVWPLWNAEEEADAWSWSLLGGLLGRRGDADAARWRYLWFFGGEAPNTKALGKEDAP